MSVAAPPQSLSPADVERASRRDGKRYELINGELKEKNVGTKALFIASQICDRLNAVFYPAIGFACVEAMIYCFAQPGHGRKPDVTFVRFDQLPGKTIPDGDIFVPPVLVVEVLSPGNSGVEVDEKLDEYLSAGIEMVWIVNPDKRTIRVFRSNGTMRLYRGSEVIENELSLLGFRLVVDEVFPSLKG
jgi:Uma2 family endonuclease